MAEGDELVHHLPTKAIQTEARSRGFRPASALRLCSRVPAKRLDDPNTLGDHSRWSLSGKGLIVACFR